MTRQSNNLRAFFYPESVAVIGVSPDPKNLARNMIHNLLTFGYQGEFIPMGRREGVISGQRIRQSLDEINHSIDLAAILTPAKTIPGILEECGQKGIRWAVIESGGFSETGEEALPLEEACLKVAKKYGIRFIGPNGIGLANMENGLVLPFWPLREDLFLGSVSVLVQSGGVGLSYLKFLAEENIGLNKFVSMGNKLNVDENDLLAYLIEDEGTRIILVYLEGFTDGRRFVEVASRSDKPILVHKSNRFRASAQIAHSHTAALFADDQLVDYALEQAGCVRVNTMDDAIDYLKILSLPPLRGNRLTVVSRSGGHAVISADACGHYGFKLPLFPKDFLKAIESRLRANVIRLQNPLDLGDLFDLAFYETIVEELMRQADVDGILLMHGYRSGPEQEDSRKLILKVEELVDRYQKPVAVVVVTESDELDYLKRHSKIGIFTAPENAMRAFDLSFKLASRERSAPDPLTRPFNGAGLSKAEDILSKAIGRDYLFLDESLELIRHYGLPVIEYRLARSPEEAVKAWHSFGGSVAVKLNRPHVSHKSDEGLVRLNVSSEAGVHEIFEVFRSKFVPKDVEVLIQPMASEGQEVILGGKQDGVFGPVILFGLGGTFVEVLRDVVWRVAPINAREAWRMIHQIKGRNVLEGIRGQGPYDLDSLGKSLIQIAQLLTDLPMIQEIDVNPVKLNGTGEGILALDARVAIGNEH